jgi:hypothetical protein
LVKLFPVFFKLLQAKRIDQLNTGRKNRPRLQTWVKCIAGQRFSADETAPSLEFPLPEKSLPIHG